MAKTRREWAAYMAGRGINVFILEADSKRPIAGKSWFVSQTQNPDEIDTWFDHYEDCNYGLHLADDHVVIDLDVKPHLNGVRAFDKICEENGLPDFRTESGTLTVKTPGGGYHLYFKAPFPCANKNSFPDGIDVRGQIGYVVGPGSKDPRGEWELLDPDAEILPLPDFLVEYIEKPGKRTPHADIPVVDLDLPESIEEAMEFMHTRKPAIEGQNGDDWTYETILFLRDFGLSPAEQLRALTQSGWNAKCEPPWDHGELEGKIDNAWQYGKNRPGNRSPIYKIQRLMQARPAGGYAAVLSDDDIHRMFHPPLTLGLDDDTATSANDDDPEIPAAVADSSDEDRIDQLPPSTRKPEEEQNEEPWWEDFSDFIDNDRVRDYVVADWLIAHGITHLIAARGTGKSTIALDLACHVALDLDWCDMPTAKNWSVLYLCGEDSEGMRLNGRAWVKEHDGLRPSSDRFRVCSKTISLNNNADLKEHIAEIDEWAKDRRVVVILDTWQRSTAGKSKNDEEAMEAAIERAEWLARRLKGPMLSLVHPPKDGRSTVMGAGVQENTTSGLWTLKKEESGTKLTIIRAKGAGEGKYFDFDIRKCQLEGKDQFGRPLTGVTAVKIGGAEAQNENSSGNDHQDGVVAEAVRKVLEEKEATCEDDGLSTSALGQMLEGSKHDGHTFPRISKTKANLLMLFGSDKPGTSTRHTYDDGVALMIARKGRNQTWFLDQTNVGIDDTLDDADTVVAA